jgi:hypothetical protein
MSEAVKAASPGTASPGAAARLLTAVAAQAAAGGSAGGSSTGSTILLQTPPPAMTALGAGQVVRAVVVGRTADGKTLLDTRFGQLALDLPVSPHQGQILRLQIAHSGLPLELNLLPVSDGDEEKARQTPFAQLRPGHNLHGGFRQFNAGQPGVAAGRGASSANAGAIALNLRVLSVRPPGAAPSADGGDEMVITGTVGGSVRGGGTLLHTAIGTLQLPTLAGAPRGAQLVLQIIGRPGTVLPLTLEGAQAKTLSAISHGWPALQEAIDAVRTASPERSAATLSASVPTTGPQLAAGLAFFLNAVFGATFQDWLGRDMTRLLETQRRGDLIARLADDFSEFSRLAGEPVGNDWRAVMLPLLHDGTLHQIRLYLRAHDDRGVAEEQDAGTRFVVEVELSRLGALQLDGLVRPHRFDLMVRTHRPLPTHVQNEICDLFGAASAEFRSAGQIAFKVAPGFPVAPLDAVDGHSVGVFA